MGRLILFILLSILCVSSGFAIEKGHIENTPYKIDYTNLDIDHLKELASSAYNLALTLNDSQKEEKEFYISKALGDYKLLFAADPLNIEYCSKIGELYDLLGKDRFAKEYFYKAITLQPNAHLPYEKFGNFYFTRKQYKLALKQYIKAYNQDKSIYNVNNKIGTIYQKFGDTESALKYLKQAQAIDSSNEQLINKVRSLEELNSQNAVYYQNTRIHFVED